MAKFICRECRVPCVVDMGEASSIPEYCLAAGGDADWQRCEKDENSVPSTAPAKTSDWYNVGALVWNDRYGYGKIERVDDDGISKVIFDNLTDDKSRLMAVTELREGRIRPWTFEEAPLNLKVKREETKNVAVLVGTMKNWNFYVFDSMGGSVFVSFDKIAEDCTQLDGSPCGVLEHLNLDGTWVK